MEKNFEYFDKIKKRIEFESAIFIYVKMKTWYEKLRKKKAKEYEKKLKA